MTPLLLAALAAAMPAPAPAGDGLGYVTGKDLYVRCTDNAAGSVSYCFAYIAAVHDTMRAYEVWLNMREFCVPAAASQGDLRATFVTYAREHPLDLNGQAASVVVNALKAAYACPKLPEPAPSAAPSPVPTPSGAPVKPRRTP